MRVSKDIVSVGANQDRLKLVVSFDKSFVGLISENLYIQLSVVFLFGSRPINLLV